MRGVSKCLAKTKFYQGSVEPFFPQAFTLIMIGFWYMTLPPSFVIIIT